MKIITWNINGFRSANREGYVEKLFDDSQPDFLCLQEIKMNDEIANTYNYHCYYNFAKKKGYSGTMIFTKERPLNVITKINLERFDEEGRFILLEYNNFIIINLYIPHGGRQKENHPYKYAVIENILDLIKSLNKKVIICTDFNIAHEEIDLTNYKTNYKNNMFTLEERDAITRLLNLGLVDSFREKVSDGGYYSWWSHSFNARERNMGWRIDYIFISKELSCKIKNVKYLKEQLGSDHCPQLLELDII